MARDSLALLLKFEHDKETQAANVLHYAQQHYQQNVQRLQGISDYRLEYMKQLSQKGETGVGSNTFRHYHNFLAKLDQVAKQQMQAIESSRKVVEQRKNQWLAQRQKVQSIEMLIDKNRQKMQLKIDREEQKMYDEIASQKYIRQQAR